MKQIFKYAYMSDFTKIHPKGDELLHADGRTDRKTAMTKLRVAVRNSTNARRNFTFCPHVVFICLLCILEKAAIISLHSIN